MIMTWSVEEVLPIVRIPIIGKIAKKSFKKFDADVGAHGLPKATRELFWQIKSKLEIIGKTKEIEKVLKSKPVLLVVNHEHEAEVIALCASLPDRQSIYLVGQASLKVIGPNFSQHLIPVYVKPSSFDKDEMKLTTRVGKVLNLITNIPENAQELNRKSIEKAGQVISNGGLVVMFPQGARKKSIWYPGVGHLAVSLSKNSDAYLVKAHVKGTSDLDFMRLIPGLKKVMSPLRVTFAKPRRIADYLTEDIDPKSLAKQFQDEYNAWVESIS